MKCENYNKDTEPIISKTFLLPQNTGLKESPITGHKCFLGIMCDLWHRRDGVTITCGSAMANMMSRL